MLHHASWSITWLGEAYCLQGQRVKARDLALQGLDMARAIGFGLGIGWAQRALGRIALANGALAEAATALQEALQTFTAMHARAEVARTSLDLAALARTQGSPERAATHLHDAYGLFWELRIPIYVERARHLAAAFGVSLPEQKEV
jgi:tetratricopeptide repeat protein